MRQPPDVFLSTHVIAAIVAPARLSAAALLLAIAAPVSQAQSAQPFAVQVSALFTTIQTGSVRIAGSGVELQQRFNRLYADEDFGAVSLGVGAQFTVHTKAEDRLGIVGLFLEPRYVPPTSSGRFFPYLSARLAVQRVSGEFQFAEGGSSFGTAYGAGGGFAVRITRRTNFDVGVQLTRQQYGEIGSVRLDTFNTYTAKVGVSLGYR